MSLSRRKYIPLIFKTLCQFLTSFIRIYAHSAKTNSSNILVSICRSQMILLGTDPLTSKIYMRKWKFKLHLWKRCAGIPPENLQQILKAKFL